MKELYLNDVIIRPELGVVVVGGTEQPLKPKAMEVLELLAANPGELISKRDLVDTVWGAAVVTDEVLTQAIYEIRQVLKGSAAEELIRTVPRRGYMLEATAQTQSRETKKPSRMWVFALASLALVIAVIAWFSRPDPSVTPVQPADTTTAARQLQTTADKQSIAILPFENRSDLDDDAFFVVGIHDELLTSIAKIGSLKVISRTSVMEYKNSVKKIPQIAKELGVANILEGSVQRSGNQVRINVQLIDAATDEHLWAEIFDRELTAENLFAIQSEISQNIANVLHMVLTVEEKNRINTIPTDNLHAYNAYLRGRQLMASRNVGNLQQATVEFGHAVETDPNFALAWVGLAEANSLLAGYGTLTMDAAIPLMEDAVAHALAIDDQLGEAYVSLAIIHEYYQRQSEVETAFRKAIELSPNYATAYHWYSNHMFGSSLANIAEATALREKAFELDPRSLQIGLSLALSFRAQHLFSLAERQYEKMLKLDPEFSNIYVSLGNMYAQGLGQYAKALEFYNKASQLDPGNPFILLRLIELYQALGDIEAMEEIRSRIVALTGEDFWLASYSAVFISFTERNVAATHEGINRLQPRIATIQYFKEIIGPVELILGNTNRARELFLDANPGWLDPDQWQRLIQKNPRYPCIFSWILMNTGDQVMGENLLRQTTVFLDETLPASIEHADEWNPEICYLTNGDPEKALDSIEMQLAHGHLYWRDNFFRLPMYDQIRDEPRFLAVVKERQRLITIQREAIAQMKVESLP